MGETIGKIVGYSAVFIAFFCIVSAPFRDLISSWREKHGKTKPKVIKHTPVKGPGGGPYWTSWSSFRNECISRNTFRSRKGNCRICGARSPGPSEDAYNQFGGAWCAACRRAVWDALELNYKSLSKEERSIATAREEVMRMVLLDFSDGAISEEQGKKDRERIEALYARELGLLHTRDDYYAAQKHREQEEMMENQRKIQEAMRHINSNP